MPTPGGIQQQIDRLVSHLVEIGLSSDQNFAHQRQGPSGYVEVTFPQAQHIGAALKDRSYTETYEHIARERAYNVKMADGALLQMTYAFAGGDLQQHRLAFFPAPHLEEFQNNPEIYMEDEIYADVVARSIVPFPLRFDFDARDGVHVELTHPKSHLTLGQYENCRIPLSSALTPFWFVDFVLRNFYHTAFNKYAAQLPTFTEVFLESILAAERRVIHVQVPA
ncbi:MAG TPA: DUF2290 domain-containing protein [Steroidobacter sp.]|uniref:DUF2290 domain-containing protein n=1 Tax=Steroidobacter sp. TaxID=1978227 RepID=UPI002EDB58CE